MSATFEWTIYCGIGYDADKQPLDKEYAERKVREAVLDISRLTGGATMWAAHGHSVECPDGEPTVCIMTRMTLTQQRDLDAIALRLKDALNQGSVLRTLKASVEAWL